MNRKVFFEGKTVWIEHRLTVEEAADFDERLAELMLTWIELWKKAGGIEEVFKKEAKSEGDSDD